MTGKPDFLSLCLIKGEYSEDWSPSPFAGRNWTGDFQIVLSDEQGKTISHIDLNDYYSEGLMFNSFFDFVFDDYNGDGDIDFTLGQYGSSNGNYYKIFTLSKDNQIDELKVKGDHDLFISGGSNRYSTELKKLNDHSFKKSYYDNSLGIDVEELFVWDGDLFVKSEEK